MRTQIVIWDYNCDAVDDRSLPACENSLTIQRGDSWRDEGVLSVRTQRDADKVARNRGWYIESADITFCKDHRPR